MKNLTKTQIQTLKKKLETSRNELSLDIIELEKSLKNFRVSKNFEEADPLTPHFEVSRSLHIKKKLRLNAVIKALEKIDKGTYGFCELSGLQISYERLLIIPEVKEAN